MITEVRAINFRSARGVSLELEPIAAFIGEPGTGKSNMLAGIITLLDPEDRLDPNDVRHGTSHATLEATLSNGRVISAEHNDGLPGLIVIPADLRTTDLLLPASRHPDALRCVEIFREELEGAPAPRVALVRALERCAVAVSGVVFVIEEPEMFLTPHGDRYLYRIFRRLAGHGNQVLYTTHSPGLLNVSKLEEIHLVSRDRHGVTAVEHLQPLDADDEFRAACEFDAERSELLFSRVAVLVEGMSEKQALPYVFRSLGHDVDREAISIVDCGGKTNLPLFIEICRRAHIPHVAVFDSDVRGSEKPTGELLRLNRQLRRAAGRDRYVEFNPDFEGILGIRGRNKKPARAVDRIRSLPAAQMPTLLRRIVDLTVAAARPVAPSYS